MIVIHPGMVKSATTSLQEQVYARHPGIAFLGLPAPNPAAKAAIRQICRADSIAYDEAAVAAALQPLAAAAGDRTAVLSYENFALYESKDKGLVADRLQRLFPEARILLTIRRQQDLLAAWYLQKMQKYLRKGHFLTFEDWYAMKADLPNRSILDDLRYDRIVAAYAERFGRERVSVLLFESLRQDPAAFAAALGEILAVDGGEIAARLAERQANPTIPQNLLILGRSLFPLLPRPLARRLAKAMLRRGGPPARIDIGPEVTAAVAALCAEGNRRLAADHKLPLAKHGYLL